MDGLSISAFTNKIKAVTDTMGTVVLLDSFILRRCLEGFDFEDKAALKNLITDIQQNALKMDPNVYSSPTNIKEIKDLQKDIMGIYALLKSSKDIKDVHNEAVKEYLKQNTSALESLIVPHKLKLNEDVEVLNENGRYFIFKKNGKVMTKVHVTNFVLYPISMVTIQNKDLEASLYNFRAVAATDGKSKDIVLLPEDMETMQSFQKAIQRQAAIIHPQIHDLQTHMRGFAYELTEKAWQGRNLGEQEGTTVLGYERFSDRGSKYMCTVDGTVYNMDGSIAESVVFIDPAIRLPEGQSSITNKYGNMDYDEVKWKKTAQFLLSNVMKVNKKDVMANIVGWFFSNPQEYNVRSVLQEFPLLHIAGPRSSGKSLTVSSIKQYFGHKGTSLPHFPTPPIFAQDMSISYTIPAINDEYGGSDKNQGWSDHTFNEMHKIMKHIYDKTPIEKAGKGDGGQGRFVYKVRNSLCSLGQIYIRDQSIATRAIQVSVDGSIKGTPEGDIAYATSEALTNYDDKNFITGYTLWCMQLDDDHIKKIVRDYREHNKQTVRTFGIKYDERQQQNDVAVQLGLHLMLRLGQELGVDVGFDEEFIKETVVRNAETNERLFEQTTDDALVRFLRDVAVHVKLIGNTRAATPIYGPGGLVVNHRSSNANDAGQYGRDKKKDACVYAHEYVAIKIKDMIAVINNDLSKRGKDAHEFANIQPYIESSFNKSKVKKGNGLVLAPENYRVRKKVKGKDYDGYYTIFNMDQLANINESFGDNIYWTGSSVTKSNLSVVPDQDVSQE